MNEVIKNNSELLYNQAKQKFETLEAAYESGDIAQEQQLVEEVFKAFEAFYAYAGEPNFYARFAYTDGPMWSEDYNNMMDEIIFDFRTLYREAELLSMGLSTDFNHHVVQESLLDSSLNKTIDKMKELEMYNDIGSSGVRVYARDNFLTSEKIDYDKIAGSALEIQNGNLTLPIKTIENVSKNSTITIITGNKKEGELLLGSASNGFPGNNTEVLMENNNSLSVDAFDPVFIGATNTHSSINDIIDDNPNTWFEYEKTSLKKHDIENVAKGFGFEYEAKNGQTVRWEGEPENGILRLTLQITLQKKEVINGVSLDMYIPSNLNAAASKVKNILVSNGIDSLKSVVSSASDGSGTSFYFTPQEVQVIQIVLEQDQKYLTEIGHIFFQEKTTPVDKQNYAIEMMTKTDSFANRVEGKLINISSLGVNVEETSNTLRLDYENVSNINSTSGSKTSSMNDRMSSMQIGINDNIDYGIERFEGWRWCIGIRDVSIMKVEFEDEGELITKPFYFEQEIDKISLDIDEGDTLTQDWLSYYVSIDDGITWYPINPMKKGNREDIPKIYTVKKVEQQGQEMNDVSNYIETPYPIYSLRLKIVGKKEVAEQDSGWIQSFATPVSDKNNLALSNPSHTPILNSFKIGVELNKSSDAMTSNIVLEAPDEISRDINTDPPKDDDPVDGEGGLGEDNGNDKEHNDESKIKLEILDKPDYALQICKGAEIQFNLHVKSPLYELERLNIYVANSLFYTKSYLNGEKEVTESITVPVTMLPQIIGDVFVIKAEANDTSGRSSIDNLIIKIVDCSTTIPDNPGGDLPPGGNDGNGGSGGSTTGKIDIIPKPCLPQYTEKGKDYPYMCIEDWKNVTSYAYHGTVLSATSPIKRIEFYEDGQIVRTENFPKEEYRLTYAFEQYINVALYDPSLNYSYPQVVAYAWDEKLDTQVFKIDIHDCSDTDPTNPNDPSVNGKNKIKIKNPTAKWCNDTDFKIRVGITAPIDIFTKVELYLNEIKIDEKTGARILSKEFVLTEDKIPKNTLAKFKVTAYTADGSKTLTAEEVVEFYDCINGGGNVPGDKEFFEVQYTERTKSMCLCGTGGEGENAVNYHHFEGIISSSSPVAKFEVFGSNHITNKVFDDDIPFDYENIFINTPPPEGLENICEDWLSGSLKSPGEIDPDNPDISNGKPPEGGDGNTPPPTTGGGDTTPPPEIDPPTEIELSDKYFKKEIIAFDNGLTAPTEDITYLNDPMADYDTKYWVENFSTGLEFLIDDTVRKVRENFWEGRNDWLDIMGYTYKNSKVEDPTAPFLKALYHFHKNSSNITLPQPFSKFKTWATSNLPNLTKLEVGMVYATWLFKKPTYINQSCEHYLRDGIMDMIAHYMVNDKIKRFTFHWMDFSDVNADKATLAFVTDFPIEGQEFMRAFLSYMNFEETAINAGIGNAKAIIPLDYNYKANRAITEATASPSEEYMKFSVDTPNFSRGTTYTDLSPYNWNLEGPTHPGKTAEDIAMRTVVGIYAGVESAIHEVGHAISNYGTEAYRVHTIQKYASDVGKTLDSYKEWEEISGWDTLPASSKNPGDGKTKLTKTKSGPLLDNGKEAPVSSYGAVGPGEDFAEAFDFYVVNPGLLQAYWPKKYAFMEKYVKNMYPANEIMTANEMNDPIIKIKEVPKEKPLPEPEPELISKNRQEKYDSIVEFGEWLEEFEIDEKCGCKKRKRNGKASWRVANDNTVNVTPIMQKANSITSEGNKTSFSIDIPSWFIAQLNPRPLSIIQVRIRITLEDGREKVINHSVYIYNCTKDEGNPPVDPNQPINCYKPQEVRVRYFDYDINGIKQLNIPISTLPIKNIDNHGGGTFDVGWSQAKNGVVLRQILGGTLPGIQIEGVGLSYLDLDGTTLLEEWAKKLDDYSPENRNFETVIGDPIANTLNSDWVIPATKGDFSDAPSLGGKGTYGIFKFSQDWEDTGCGINSNYNYSEPIKKPPAELYECEAKQFIALQYYDDLDKRLRYLQIDIRGTQGTTYDVQQATSAGTIITGWSDYFSGPIIQVKTGNGSTNVYLASIGLVYRDKWGESQVVWAKNLRYTTNGVHNAINAAKGFRTVEQLSWVNGDGTVDVEAATYIGKPSDLAAFYINTSAIGTMCRDDSSIDDDVDFDIENPPDVPKVIWEVLEDTACHGFQSTNDPNEFKGKITSETEFKQVWITVSVDGSIVKEDIMPFEIPITEFDFDFMVPASDYPVGTDVIITITTTNIYDKFSSEIVKINVEQCYDGTVTISTVPDFPMTFYYDDISNIDEAAAGDKVDVNFDVYVTDDLVGIKHFDVNSHIGSYEKDFPQPGLLNVQDNVSLQLPLPEKIKITNITEEVGNKIKADIVFVIDTSSSMSNGIGKVRSGLTSFKEKLKQKHINARMGYIDSDKQSGFTSQHYRPLQDIDEFILDVVLSGYEWEGLQWGQILSEQVGVKKFEDQFRAGVPKFAILLTDATISDNPYPIKGKKGQEAAQYCIDNNIKMFPMLYELSTTYQNSYKEIANLTGGDIFNFSETSFPVQGLVDLIVKAIEMFPDITYDVSINANNHYMVPAQKNGKVHLKWKD